MSNLVLWKRLTENDFNAMHGKASPHGEGGGARHIALGVRTTAFPIDRFLNAPGRSSAMVTTVPHLGKDIGGTLVFSSNPNRRGGEWLIRDQYTNRHSAWTRAAGFPSSYDPENPPYILVFRSGIKYHVRFALARQLARLTSAEIPEGLLSEQKGISPVLTGFLT